MDKFRRLYEHLVDGAMVQPGQVHVPHPAHRELLYAAHEFDYVDGVLDRRLGDKAMRRIGFPLTESVVMRSRGAVAGTLLTARLAREHGIACNTAGGSHHAFAGHGSGYCVFNDVAAAALALTSGTCPSSPGSPSRWG